MDVYDFLTKHFGLSLIDSAVLVLVFFLAKERWDYIRREVKWLKRRMGRMERSIGGHIPLLPMTEEDER